MSRLAEAGLPGFFDQAAREHAVAMASVGGLDHDVCFADRLIRLRFAGSELADALLGALRARLVGTGAAPSPHATIGLWEERRVPGGARPVPWRDVDLAARGLLRGPDGARVIAVHEAGAGAVTLVDRSARELLYRVPGVATLPWWERAAPLRPALFWALSGPGRHLVHAGAVGDPQRGGVLLAGAGGSGKTTVALAALAAGMAYVADDYLLLHTDPQPVAWNMYGTAKVDAGHLARFPGLTSAVTTSTDPVADEKAVLDIDRVSPHALAGSLRIRAVLVPRIRGGHARLRRASAGEALLALAPSTAFQMPFDDGRVVGSLATVARSVPAFALDVGDHTAELAQAIDRVLDAVTDRMEPALTPSAERVRP
jgi:hypothetical protein